MAGAISIAAVLAARQITIRCPQCGHAERVSRTAMGYRVCPRCRWRFVLITPRPVTKRRA